ncbi:hypothetical protein ACFVWR_01255 [Leifsonia sp. NPDC058292]|uniref:hypothetical protein n=1 Tax=Leifsonia sp. NPDC058292 TaxID=3346428 RepID=UPI0036D8F1B9
MEQTDNGSIFTPAFLALCVGIVFGAPFLLGSTLLVIAWVRAANYDGVGEGVYYLLIWGFWLAVIGLAGLVPLAISRIAARRERASKVLQAA